MNWKIFSLTVKLFRIPKAKWPSGSECLSLCTNYYLYRESVIRLKVRRDKFQLCWLFPKMGDTAWKDREALLNVVLVWRCRRGLFSPIYPLLNDSLLWRQLLLPHRQPTEMPRKYEMTTFCFELIAADEMISLWTFLWKLPEGMGKSYLPCWS